MRPLLLSLLLPLSLLADSFYIQEKIELPTAYRNAEASLVLADADGQTTHPCTLVRQGLEGWVIARLELERSRTYKISLRLNQPGATAHYILIDPGRQLQVHRYDVALVMDCSDSMKENDPHDLRAAALAKFFDLAKNSKNIETISLIAFRTDAELLLKPTRPDDIPDPSVFIKKLKPRASTNFDEPLAMTLDALERHGLGNQQALVFLSDGQPIRRYRDTHEKFTNTPIYTIGLSPEADGTLLSRIASDTRGQFFDAPEPTDLSSIFTQIFHLIDQPGTILRERLAADPSASLDFPVDPTMRNTTLKFAMIQGTGQVAIDGTPIPATDDLVFHPLPKLAVGSHTLSLKGPARMSAELLASTDVHLRLLQPHPSGDRGLPILTFGYVTYDAPLDAPPTISCEVRSPDGASTPMTLGTIGTAGVFRAAFAETRAAGPYTVAITARGSIDGQPFLRTSQLVYERTGRQLQAQTDDASIIQRERKPDTSTHVAPAALPIVPLAPAAGPLDVAAPSAALQTTFWASAPHLDFPTLYPGETHSEAIDILINTTSPAPLSVGIPEDETAPIALTFDGKPHKNRRATITVTAIPRARTASAWERPLEIRLADEIWTIPLRGSLAVPSIQVDTTDIQIDETASELIATSRLTVQLVPQGTADLTLSSDLGPLEINPPALAGRAALQRVQLTFRVPKPLAKDSWQGTVTVAGDGLEPAQVPFRIDIAQDTITDTAGLGPSGSASSSGPGFPWWWLLLMLLIILLLALVLASVRGNKRAAFILASLLIHAALLFLYIPKPEVEESHDAPSTTVTTMTVSTGEVMQERQIASEVAEFQSESDAPAESAAEMASADAPAESAEQAAQATLESEEAFERPEPEVQPEESANVEREQMEVQELQSETQEIERKQEAVETTAAAAESQEQSKETVETEAPSAESQALEATKAEAQVAESAAASQVKLDVERQEVTPENLQTETQEIERKQETVETTAATAESQERTKETLETEAPSAESQALEATKAEAQVAESAAVSQVKLDVERQEVTPENLQSETQEIERKQETVETAAATAESQERTKETLETEAPSAESQALEATKAEAQVAESAAASQVKLDVQREAVTAEAIQSETQDIQRKQESVEITTAEAADSQSETRETAQAAESASESAVVEVTAAEAAESAPAPEITAPAAESVERREVNAEAIASQTEALERKKAASAAAAAEAAAQSDASAPESARAAESAASAAATVKVSESRADAPAAAAAAKVPTDSGELRASSELAELSASAAEIARKQAQGESAAAEAQNTDSSQAPAALAPRPTGSDGPSAEALSAESVVADSAPVADASPKGTPDKVAPASNTLSDLSGETIPVPRAKSATGGGNAPSATPAASTGSAVSASNPDRAAGDAQAGADSLAPASAAASPLSASNAARPATGPTSRPSNSLSDLASDSTVPTPRGSAAAEGQTANATPAASNANTPSSLAPRPSGNTGSGESSLAPASAAASPLSASNAARPATGPTSRPSNSLSDLASDSAAPTPRGSAQGQAQVADSAAPATGGATGPSSLAPRPSSPGASTRMVEPGLSPRAGLAAATPSLRSPQRQDGPLSHALADLTSAISAAGSPGRGQASGPESPDSGPAAASASGPSTLAPRPAADAGGGSQLAPSTGPMAPSASPLAGGGPRSDALGPVSRPSTSLSDLAGGPGSAQQAPRRGGGGGQAPSDAPGNSGGVPLASGGSMATSPLGSEGEGPESRELALGGGPAAPISPASPLAGGPGSGSGPVSRPTVGPSDLSGQSEPMARAPRRGSGSGSGQTPSNSSGPVGAPAAGGGPLGLSGGVDGIGDIGQDGDGFDIASVQSEIALLASPGLAPEALSLARGDGDGKAGKWDNTLPLLKYNGDWDCDKTAMLNLAHQYERRTGSLLALESRTIELDNPELEQTPFLFMTGHDPYHFNVSEIENLRSYLNGGGYIWINDSTDLGNERFDYAVRREMARVLPNSEWVRIPRSSNLFKGPYDLTKGYKGYAVPPGDKYRQDYHEGLMIDGRLAVIYTRNDYGDGLEIDPRTHPLMSSLSGLSPQEMAEGSVRMGINIVSYFVNDGGLPSAKTRDSVAREQEAEDNKLAEYLALPSTALPVPEPEQEWVQPEGWGDTIPVEVETRIIGSQTAVRLDFAKSDGGAVTRVEKVVLQSSLPLTLGRDKALLMDIMSHLKGGARVALAFANGDDYFETAPVFIRPGLNGNVVFDFEDIRCKSANSNWAYTENFPARLETERWFILLYPQSGSGRVDIGNMRTADK